MFAVGPAPGGAAQAARAPSCSEEVEFTLGLLRADRGFGRASPRERDQRRCVLGCEIMTREAEKLLEVAATLLPAERAALVVRLLDSIAAPDDDVAAAQRSESRARLDAAHDGAIDLVDDDDAMRMIAG